MQELSDTQYQLHCTTKQLEAEQEACSRAQNSEELLRASMTHLQQLLDEANRRCKDADGEIAGLQLERDDAQAMLQTASDRCVAPSLVVETGGRWVWQVPWPGPRSYTRIVVARAARCVRHISTWLAFFQVYC